MLTLLCLPLVAFPAFPGSAAPALASSMRGAPLSAPAARPTEPVPLVTGTAEIGRRGRNAARASATHQALVEAVWRGLGEWVSKDRQTQAVRRSLGVGVRNLIARYRTREITTQGKQLTVHLAVTVDEQALVKRLRALGVPVLSPGVLLLAHCEKGALAKGMASSLASAGLRSVTGPWDLATIPSLVTAVRTRPEVAVARARAAKTRVAVVISCQSEPLQSPAAGVIAAGIRLLLTVHAEGAAAPILWSAQARATSLGADEATASRGAMDSAAKRLFRRVVRDLPRALPPGPERALPLQLLGGMSIPAALDLANRISREIEGVEAVVPYRLAPGELWFQVRTVHDQAALTRALSRLAPPEGLQLSAQILRPAGHVALSVRALEETP